MHRYASDFIYQHFFKVMECKQILYFGIIVL